MGRTKRRQIYYKQIQKRRKRRRDLKKNGKDPDSYFYDGFYVTKS